VSHSDLRHICLVMLALYPEKGRNRSVDAAEDLSHRNALGLVRHNHPGCNAFEVESTGFIAAECSSRCHNAVRDSPRYWAAVQFLEIASMVVMSLWIHDRSTEHDVVVVCTFPFFCHSTVRGRGGPPHVAKSLLMYGDV